MPSFEDFKLEETIVEGWIITSYKGYMGAFLSHFFSELRDNKRILGVRCPACGIVYMPPRSTCGRCFSQLSEWVELKDEGTVESFTVVHKPLPIYPRPTPLIYALIKLDGADTPFVHLLGEVEPDGVTFGMRVKAVFEERRSGGILDIKYFKPIRS